MDPLQSLHVRTYFSKIYLVSRKITFTTGILTQKKLIFLFEKRP